MPTDPAAAPETPAAGTPLRGLRVIQLAGLGPVPHAARVLSDLGAEIVRVGVGPVGTSSGPAN